MKRRILKKHMNQILDSNLPTVLKLSAMHSLMECVRKYDVFLHNNLLLEYKRFSTTLHKGIVTVSEHERVDEVSFSSWYKAMVWICKQAKTDTEYVVDSGHYRYRVCFSL